MNKSKQIAKKGIKLNAFISIKYCYIWLGIKQADPFVFVLSPLREFSFIFRYKVCSTAGGNIKKLEILPRLHFERAKSAER